jgi:hypothetical protein
MKSTMKVKIGSSALGINWDISVPDIGVTLSKADNIDNIDKLMMAIAPLHEKLSACGHPTNRQQNLASALVDALLKWELDSAKTATPSSSTATATTPDPTDYAPLDQLMLSVKSDDNGLHVKALLGGFPGKSEAVITDAHQIDQFVYSIIDMLESSGNGTSSETLDSVRSTITTHWRGWYAHNVILGGRSVAQAASENFSKCPVDFVRGFAEARRKEAEAADQAEAREIARKKELLNDEIARNSPNSFHELALRESLDGFTHKGKMVFAVGLNIGDAIQALEEGYRVACEHWPKNVYLFMAQSAKSYDFDGFDDFIAMHTSQGDNSPWSPTQKSLVDRTWCILA